MPAPPRVSSSIECPSAPKFIAERIVRALRAADLPVPAIAVTHGLHDEPPGGRPPDPDGRVPIGAIHELWEHAAHAGAGASFPVTTALIELSEMCSALTFLCTSSPTLGEAVARLVESWPAMTGAPPWRFEPNGAEARLVLDAPPPQTLGERCHVEYLVADLVHTGRLAMGDDLRVGVTFRHRAPADGLEVHHALFGDGLRWGADAVSLALPVSSLGTPMKTAAPGLAAVLEQRLEGIRQREAVDDRVTTRLRSALRTTLEGGAPDVRLEIVARRLALGPRTLLRRLRAEGTTYQAVLDDVRRDLARELLSARGKSSKEVSSALGFSDARAFARAFRRWTGRSPGAFRSTSSSVSSKVPSLSPSNA